MSGRTPTGGMEQVPRHDEDGPLGPVEMAELYRRHWPDLRRLVAGVVGDVSAADDVLQTAFAKAIESGGPDNRQAAKAWLFQIAVNEALVVRRRRRVEQRAQRHLHASQKSDRLESAPEIPIARAETIHQVRDALAQLPSSQQQVVRARLYDGKRFAQIAKELGVPIGTVVTRMRRALERLRVVLRELDS